MSQWMTDTQNLSATLIRLKFADKLICANQFILDSLLEFQNGLVFLIVMKMMLAKYMQLFSHSHYYPLSFS